MPTYVFTCPDCKETIERRVPIIHETPTCPKCEAEMQKSFSPGVTIIVR